MLIDFHTHIFPDKIASRTIDALAANAHATPHTDGTAEGLIAHMKSAGADISVNLPVLTKPDQFDSVLEFAKTINEKYSCGAQRIISFAGMHPLCDDIKGKMKRVKEAGVKGVKIHPDYQGTFIDNDGYIEIFNAAKDNDLIVVTHAGVDDGFLDKPIKCPPELAAKVIKKVGYNKIVLGHYGGHKQWEKVLDLLVDLNVYFDTAFTFYKIDEELFKKILYAHGADRILFATDCPWSDIKKDKETFLSYSLPKEIKDKVLYENALKLLQI
ncbi:MAG: amidohydrolase family protein [Clostridia bacterium]|nr:amidohydrolase family protein [Clostridia bacterium]